MLTRGTSRGNVSSTRVRFALTAAFGAMLVGGFAGSLALRHAATQHSSAVSGSAARPANTIGGYAEHQLAHPATRIAGLSGELQPLGGYAEMLRSQLESPLSPLSAGADATDSRGGYAEFVRDQPAATETLDRYQSTPEAADFGFASEGRPMGGYAEWLHFQAL